MKLELVRVARKPNYTIGKLYVNGTYFCDTLEDTDRSLRSEMSFNEIANLKIKGKTAIPYGTYAIDLDTVSPRFGSQAFYKEVCNGKLPRLVNVNGYDGVLIHVGNDDGDTDGCILVGYNTVVGKVTNSKDAFRRLMQAIYARPAGEAVTLEIKKKTE